MIISYDGGYYSIVFSNFTEWTYKKSHHSQKGQSVPEPGHISLVRVLAALRRQLLYRSGGGAGDVLCHDILNVRLTLFVSPLFGRQVLNQSRRLIKFPSFHTILSIQVHFGASTKLLIFYLFCSWSSGYQLGYTVAVVSAQRPMEHVKNALQNIKTEWTPYSVGKSPTSCLRARC